MNATSAGVYEFRTLSARAAASGEGTCEEGMVPDDAPAVAPQAAVETAAAIAAAMPKSLMTVLRKWFPQRLVVKRYLAGGTRERTPWPNDCNRRGPRSLAGVSARRKMPSKLSAPTKPVSQGRV